MLPSDWNARIGELTGKVHASVEDISKETKAWLVTTPQGRFSFVFTPKHGSWLNLVEGIFRTGHLLER